MLDILMSMPATSSAITLVLITALFTLLSIVVLHFVKFSINEKEWGKEIIDAFKVVKIIRGLLYSEKGLLTVGSILRYNSDNLYRVERYEVGSFRITGFWNYLFPDGSGGVNVSDGYEDYRVFSDLEKLTEFVDNSPLISRSSINLRFNPLWLLLFPLTDLSLYCFGIAPVATIAVLSTLGTVFSVRWVSGKLAHNVKKTDNHEERISKLEGTDEKS